MKKLISLFLIISLLFAFSACAAGESGETTAPAEVTDAAVAASAESTGTDAGNSTTDKKILTIYFSSANTTAADVVSSATPDFDGTASTQYLAEYIHEKVGGDIVKITPVSDYPTDYNGTADKAKAERDNDERPEFQALEVNPEDYDVIFVGYPMWWYTLPMVMYTFFDTYDFSGKTLIPFNTHAGSGDGGTYDEIREFEPEAAVLDGLAVSGSRADKADSDIDAWIEEVLK